MSRSGYSDDLDQWDLIKWRGRVASAIRGKRGQAMLIALRDALDSMPKKALIEEELITKDGDCCAMGALAKARSIDVSKIDPGDCERVAVLFNVSPCLAQEIAYENDECDISDFVPDGERWKFIPETPEKRWERMRNWVASKIKE